jgi:hypothetical protein
MCADMCITCACILLTVHRCSWLWHPTVRINNLLLLLAITVLLSCNFLVQSRHYELCPVSCVLGAFLQARIESLREANLWSMEMPSVLKSNLCEASGSGQRAGSDVTMQPSFLFDSSFGSLGLTVIADWVPISVIADHPCSADHTP